MCTHLNQVELPMATSELGTSFVKPNLKTVLCRSLSNMMVASRGVDQVNHHCLSLCHRCTTMCLRKCEFWSDTQKAILIAQMKIWHQNFVNILTFLLIYIVPFTC